MSEMDNYETIKICKSCGTTLKYTYGEIYKCSFCGREELSDFGKVKEFIRDNGAQTAMVIHQATGVSLEYINSLLEEGRIEIPESSDCFVKCRKCGTDIRYGRYCPDCIASVSMSVGGAFKEVAGEKPKLRNNRRNEGMHYLHGEN